MKLPHADEAVVPRPKITDYLLSVTHPVGRDKAAFFQQFGFRAEEWSLLADAFRVHVVEHEVTDSQDSPFGIRYAVDGQLETPDGRRPLVRVVWFVDKAASLPRFVTAYPLGRSTQ